MVVKGRITLGWTSIPPPRKKIYSYSNFTLPKTEITNQPGGAGIGVSRGLRLNWPLVIHLKIIVLNNQTITITTTTNSVFRPQEGFRLLAFKPIYWHEKLQCDFFVVTLISTFLCITNRTFIASSVCLFSVCRKHVLSPKSKCELSHFFLSPAVNQWIKERV